MPVSTTYVHVCAPNGASVTEEAAELVEVLRGEGIDASALELRTPLAAADRAAALEAAATEGGAETGAAVVSWAPLPDELSMWGFDWQCQVAATLGAGLAVAGVCSARALDEARAAAIGHGVVLAAWHDGDRWQFPRAPQARAPRLKDPSAQLRAFCVEAGHGVADVVQHIERDTCVVLPGDRTDVALGMLLAVATGACPQPGALVVQGQMAPGLAQAFRRRMPDLELVELGPEDNGACALLDIVGRSERPRTAAGFKRELLTAARRARRHIVLPEGEEPRIVRAAAEIAAVGGATLTLLGDPERIREIARDEALDVSSVSIVDPKATDMAEDFAVEYARLRAKKGVTLEQARERMLDVSYFGTMMVHQGLADGMVSGAVHTTAHTIKPSFEIIKTAPGVGVVSSVFFMCLDHQVLVFGDCAVNPNPTAQQLADIARSSAATARQFGVDPRVALLSYSTKGSGTGPDVDLVTEATRLAQQAQPDLALDGPLQFDAAVEPSVARSKAPDSSVAGRANVLIFPDLSAGNAAYKAVQRTAGAVAIGPVLQGLNKPVNDLSRGATVEDIVNTVLVTAVQAGASE